MYKQRIYVGASRLFTSQRSVFHSDSEPTAETHPQYAYVIGPFRTKRAAEFMRDFGANNPHCQCVADAERLAKLQAAGKL
jgi:hypothetical protein